METPPQSFPGMTVINIEEEIREIQAALQKLEGISKTVGTAMEDTNPKGMAPHKIKAAKKRKAKRKRGGPR